MGEVYRAHDTKLGRDEVLADGRFVMLAAERAARATYVNVIVNWADEVAARVPR